MSPDGEKFESSKIGHNERVRCFIATRTRVYHKIINQFNERITITFLLEGLSIVILTKNKMVISTVLTGSIVHGDSH